MLIRIWNHVGLTSSSSPLELEINESGFMTAKLNVNQLNTKVIPYTYYQEHRENQLNEMVCNQVPFSLFQSRSALCRDDFF